MVCASSVIDFSGIVLFTCSPDQILSCWDCSNFCKYGKPELKMKHDRMVDVAHVTGLDVFKRYFFVANKIIL